MKRAFVVGHPVAHSRSPLIHGHWLAEHAIAGGYERVDVPPEDVPTFLDGCREGTFVGGNVTLPNKEVAFRHLAGGAGRVTAGARRLGAVNTVWLDGETGRLVGDNTDGFGFVQSLDEQIGRGWEAGVATALVLGAGGAARAIVGALLDRGIATVRVGNRSRDRARALLDLAPDRVAVAPWPPAAADVAAADLLVNTTQLGMRGQPDLPVGLDPLGRDAIVADIVYVPLETPLLAAARARGARTCDGLGMLLHQARPGFERWFGIAPMVTPALRSRVEADLGPAP